VITATLPGSLQELNLEDEEIFLDDDDDDVDVDDDDAYNDIFQMQK